MKAVIADDQPQQVLQMRQILKKLDIEVVAACADGAEAWKAILREKPDLAILDYSMPELTGAQVAQKVYDSDLPVKVFLATANGQRGAAYNPDIHVVGVINKPFNAVYVKQAILEACK